MGRFGECRLPKSSTVTDGVSPIRRELNVGKEGCYEIAADGRLPMRESALRDHGGAANGLYMSLHRLPAVDEQRLLDGACRCGDGVSSQRRGAQTSAAHGR